MAIYVFRIEVSFLGVWRGPKFASDMFATHYAWSKRITQISNLCTSQQYLAAADIWSKFLADWSRTLYVLPTLAAALARHHTLLFLKHIGSGNCGRCFILFFSKAAYLER